MYRLPEAGYTSLMSSHRCVTLLHTGSSQLEVYLTNSTEYCPKQSESPLTW